MTFKWRDSYSVHNTEIDAEHQHLFSLINHFSEARDTITKTESSLRLIQYTREHFAHEESLMREIAYPAIAAHVEQHSHLLDRMLDLGDQVSKDLIHSSELKTALASWLVGHIVTFDATLFTYVNHKEEHASSQGPA